MISISYKEGVNKNNKSYMLCFVEFDDKDGNHHRERFFVKPWNVKALAEAIDYEKDLTNKVQDIYG